MNTCCGREGTHAYGCYAWSQQDEDALEAFDREHDGDDRAAVWAVEMADPSAGFEADRASTGVTYCVVCSTPAAAAYCDAVCAETARGSLEPFGIRFAAAATVRRAGLAAREALWTRRPGLDTGISNADHAALHGAPGGCYQCRVADDEQHYATWGTWTY